MEKFIGLGSDHETDVYDRVNTILKKEKPSVITLEQKMNVWNLGDSSDNPRLKERKNELFKLPNYKFTSQGKEIILKINDWLIYSHFDYQKATPELSAGINFALKQKLPFYFTDWSQDFPEYIFKFEKGIVQPISLASNTTYQDYPEEFMKYGEKIIIGTDNIAARNRFTSDAINFISRSTDSLAHIGGDGHFDSRITGRLSKNLELQHLIRTKKKIVYNLVINARKQEIFNRPLRTSNERKQF